MINQKFIVLFKQKKKQNNKNKSKKKKNKTNKQTNKQKRTPWYINTFKTQAWLSIMPLHSTAVIV